MTPTERMDEQTKAAALALMPDRDEVARIRDALTPRRDETKRRAS